MLLASKWLAVYSITGRVLRTVVFAIFLLLLFWFGLVLVFQGRVLLCNNSPGCPGIHSIDQAGLELTETDLPPEC